MPLSLDSLYKTFHMKLSSICTKMNLQGNTFPYEWSCTKTRFDVEVKCDLEMADLIFYQKVLNVTPHGLSNIVTGSFLFFDQDATNIENAFMRVARELKSRYENGSHLQASIMEGDVILESKSVHTRWCCS